VSLVVTTWAEVRMETMIAEMRRHSTIAGIKMTKPVVEKKTAAAATMRPKLTSTIICIFILASLTIGPAESTLMFQGHSHPR
jgi:hypothetical protein